jgi:hypothetical protein
MTSFKLSNAQKSYEINGTPYRVGKLTLGAAVQIESHLSKLKTPLEIYNDSKALAVFTPGKAEEILNKAAQETMFWPPDAVTALCNTKFLTRGDFGIVFISAILAAYNPHLSPQEIENIAKSATTADVVQLQLIAFGADETDPKGAAAAPATPKPADTLNG